MCALLVLLLVLYVLIAIAVAVWARALPGFYALGRTKFDRMARLSDRFLVGAGIAPIVIIVLAVAIGC